MWTNFSSMAFLFPKVLLFGFFPNWFSWTKFSHLCTFENNVYVTFVFEKKVWKNLCLWKAQCDGACRYFFLFFRDVSLFSGIHASSNTSALVLISDLVDVRFIFPLTAFNNFPTTCFKQFDCDRLGRNYIYISQNWDFWMYSLITYKNFGTTIFYLFFFSFLWRLHHHLTEVIP